MIGERVKGLCASLVSSYMLFRLAVYEMLYRDDVPVSVSINEAVELSKKYSTKDDTSFINGVLGAVSKSL